MDLITKLRRGEGPFWGPLKSMARKVLRFHLPAGGPARPFFSLLYHAHVVGREGLGWALRFFWYEPLFRSQCAVVGEGFQMEQLPYIQGVGRIVIGRYVTLSGKSSLSFGNRLSDRPELCIGDHTFIGHGCSLSASASIRIGRHCLLASGVRVADHDGHPLDAARRRALEPVPPEAVRPVVIGDDVWIGTGAFVLKGVTVGDRSVIGAGSVVTRDVPPDVVVAGTPAQVMKQLGSPVTRVGVPAGSSS